MNPNLSPEQFHGTVADLGVGDHILPTTATGAPRNHSIGDPDVAYATSDVDAAWHYAELAHAHEVNRRLHGPFPVPRVLRVQPLADDLRDVSGNSGFSGDVASPTGFRVVGEVPLPEHMGDPDDWRI